MVVVLYDTTSEREARNAMRGRQPTAAARPLPSDTRTGKGYFARSVGAYIPKVVAAAFEKFGFHTAEIMTSWETIVGADLGRMTRPESIKWPRGAKARAGGDEDGTRRRSDPHRGVRSGVRARNLISHAGYRRPDQSLFRLSRDCAAARFAGAANGRNGQPAGTSSRPRCRVPADLAPEGGR